MDCNVVDCEMAERDGGECAGCGGCSCEGGSLEVLKEVQRAYEQRLEMIVRAGGPNKLQNQVKLLQCWVSDLVGQNALLARTVEQLEEEVTTRLLLERRRHAELESEARAEAAALRRRLVRKDGDLRGVLEVLRRLRDPALHPSVALAKIHFNEQRAASDAACDRVNELKTLNESLQKDIEIKDREIRRLNQSTEQYEQVIACLKQEMMDKHHKPDVSKADAEVTADMCCPGLQVGEIEPVKDYTALLRKETAKYQGRLEQIEEKVKSSSERVRALREANVALATEAHTLRQLCTALAEQARLADMHAQFADHLVREMRRQLIQAKAKGAGSAGAAGGGSSPDTSRELAAVRLAHDSATDVLIHDRSSSPPIVVSDTSTDSSTERPERPGRRGAGPRPRTGRPTADVDSEAKPQCQSRACSAKLKESIGSSSRAASAASEARSRRLEHQLSVTLQVLKNKEETVRVQAESLALAEQRIATLAALAARTDRPRHSSRSSADGCCVETAEVPAQTQEEEHGEEEDDARALRDDLSAVGRLYRECFYERARQEELLELQREAGRAARRRERLKDARIARLQRSLHSCRDVVAEVESLKTEISNFLNSSNNDSGMWERPEEPLPPDVADELHHISGQLLRLRGLLAEGCSCGLQDENTKLKRINEKLETHLDELRRRVTELEALLEDKENLAQHQQQQMQLKDKELGGAQQRLAALEAAAAEHRAGCSDLHAQVQHLQAVLRERSEELSLAQRQCEERAAAAGRLRRELASAESGALEKEKVLSEVSQLSAGVARWRERLADGRRRLRALDDELQRERRRRRHVEHHCREKSQQAAALQTQLEEARARGAALCGEAQRAVAGVRRWLRRARHTHREQERTIEEQDELIRSLQRRRRTEGGREGGRAPPGDSTDCSCCPSRLDAGTSASDATGGSGPAPAPPRRAQRQPLCEDRRTVSPVEELLERVDRTHEALEEARRRWRRGASAADLTRPV